MSRRAAIAAILGVVVAACGTPQAPSATPSPTPAPTPTRPPTPTPLPFAPVPALVQVENSPAGRPQSGLASASIVYEYVAEGGVGRFSLLFFEPPEPKQLVGPIRSARTVTIELAKVYEAYVAYSGASTYILGLLRAAPFASFNEDTAQASLFRVGFRDAPHNLYTNGAGIIALAALAHARPTDYTLWDWTRTKVLPPGGAPMSSARIPISFAEQPVFTWHPELGGYTRTESTGLVRDPATGKPLVIPTVIVQQVPIVTDPNVIDVNGVHGVDHLITGTGNAQIFTGGRVYTATWRQPPSGPPQFTLPGGVPARIAPGEVWIALVATGQPATVR